MSLPAGTHLGHYEIHAPLGAGGMGEVYRARDCRLDRTVAIKVLPARFAADPEFCARFEREARAISHLNHPHICTLYDVGGESGVAYLVLEYLEGETLSDRLARGALPFEQALRHALDIADALDAAHRNGIVHRDLKPGNVMLTKAGAKLLDFGLAKPVLTPGAASAAPGGPDALPDGVSSLPTRQRPLTARGAMLGTVPYMAPEQLEGKEADTRTDVFAFGALVYEMATGHRAFEGTSQAGLISAILKDDPPPIAASQPLTPPGFDHIIGRCLAKDPDERWQTMADLKRELKWMAEASSRPRTVATIPPEPTRWAMAARVLGGVAAITIATLLWSARARPPQTPLWFSIIPPPPPIAHVPLPPAPALSPDGQEIAFVARDSTGRGMLWVRPLTSPTARILPGTQGAGAPFWSPDGRSLGFFAERKLKRVDVDGGSPEILADAPTHRGGSWGREGVIIFSPTESTALFQVSAAGGPVRPVTMLEDAAGGDNSHRHPHFLPDGRGFLYWRRSPDQRNAGLYAGSLDSTAVKLVQVNGSRAEFSNGHLLFGRDGSLFAQPFDLRRLEVTGPAVRVAEGLGLSGGDLAAYAFSSSPGGTVAYSTGSLYTLRQLRWFDRSGTPLGTIGEPGEYIGLSLAPDERRVALERHDPKANTVDVWLMDLATGVSSRLTAVSGFDAWAATPLWSHEGSQLLFTDFTDRFQLRGLRGGRIDALVHGLAGSNWLLDWSPDGHYVVFQRTDPETSLDIWVLPLVGDRRPLPYVNSSFIEGLAQVSPDGRSLTYVSNESGRSEVYVDAFPRPEGKLRLSTGGGLFPRWRKDGKEIYYVAPDRMLMVVSVTPETTSVRASTPRALFAVPQLGLPVGRVQYDVVGRGEKFLFNAPTDTTTPEAITVVVNWRATLGK